MELGSAVLVSGPTNIGGGHYVFEYRATGAGVVKFKQPGYTSNEVTILPKPHPMKKFMEIIGFGMKK